MPEFRELNPEKKPKSSEEAYKPSSSGLTSDKSPLTKEDLQPKAQPAPKEDTPATPKLSSEVKTTEPGPTHHEETPEAAQPATDSPEVKTSSPSTGNTNLRGRWKRAPKQSPLKESSQKFTPKPIEPNEIPLPKAELSPKTESSAPNTENKTSEAEEAPMQNIERSSHRRERESAIRESKQGRSNDSNRESRAPKQRERQEEAPRNERPRSEEKPKSSGKKAVFDRALFEKQRGALPKAQPSSSSHSSSRPKFTPKKAQKTTSTLDNVVNKIKGFLGLSTKKKPAESQSSDRNRDSRGHSSSGRRSSSQGRSYSGQNRRPHSSGHQSRSSSGHSGNSGRSNSRSK